MDDLFLKKKKKITCMESIIATFFFFVKLNILYNYFDFHLYRKFIIITSNNKMLKLM